MTQPSPGDFSFDDESDQISPTWWRGSTGTEFRFLNSILYMGLASSAELAIWAGLPGVCPTDAYPWACADRNIVAGPNESTTHLAGRLQQWLTLAQFTATPTGVLLGVESYAYPDYPFVCTVSSSPGSTGSTVSIWNSYSTGVDPFPTTQSLPTPPYRNAVTPANWNWDGNSDPWYGVPAWWRAWVIIQSNAGPWPQPSATFGGCAWGDGTCLGWAGSTSDAAALFTIARWQKGGVVVPQIIVSYNASNFDQTQVFGSPVLPDGHYGHWGRVSSTAVSGSTQYDYTVASSGGYPSVYTTSSTTHAPLASASYGSVWVGARKIGPASYIDGPNS